ncbi:MAG TPA: BCCT family transporter, partial [Pseudomonadaceae bacterium]|nr:BCCT family transporter [Pseudomonadaceae bacterium]
RLGPPDSTPEFAFFPWLAMLFSAGMGIGLVFFGVAEPVLHFLQPPTAEPLSVAAAREAMRYSIFHWGLHAWAIYAVLGLALALFHFRLGQPLAIRSTLAPLLGRHTHRWPGKSIDVLAVLGTLFGLATSLGLGAAQISAGLQQLFGVSEGLATQIWVIVVITFFATLSLVLGLEKGIRRLSELNLVLAGLLLLFVLLIGPTAVLLRGIVDNLGNYLQNLPAMSLSTHPFRGLDWQKSWTIFYWSWWLSWAPFVGVFIARISRGRTLREFVVGVLLLPTLLSLVWFGVFGGAALHIELEDSDALSGVVSENSALAIYVLLEHLPFAELSSFLAMLLVAVFFITSSDSGSFVVDMLTSGGNPNPPVVQRIFWASLEGLIAIMLLLTGGLAALQAGAVSMGLPFALVLLGVAVALVRQLRIEMRAVDKSVQPRSIGER